MKYLFVHYYDEFSYQTNEITKNEINTIEIGLAEIFKYEEGNFFKAKINNNDGTNIVWEQVSNYVET